MRDRLTLLLGRSALLLAIGALALAPPVGAAEAAPAQDAGTAPVSEDAPVDDFDDALYAFDSLTGDVVLQPDVGYTYCPASASGTAILALRPDEEATAIADLGATVNPDGTWVTDDGSVVKPQRAAAVMESPSLPPSAASSLPTIPRSRLVLVQPTWPNCRRFIRRHLCLGCYHCPQGCFNIRWANACSVKFSGTRNFKLCRYTGNPWDWCYQYTFYRCTATGYNCNDCGGAALWSVNWIGWSCWTAGC